MSKENIEKISKEANKSDSHEVKKTNFNNIFKNFDSALNGLDKVLGNGDRLKQFNVIKSCFEAIESIAVKYDAKMQDFLKMANDFINLDFFQDEDQATMPSSEDGKFWFAKISAESKKIDIEKVFQASPSKASAEAVVGKEPQVTSL